VKVGWGMLDAGKNPVNDCHEMVEDAKGRLIMLGNETKNNVLIYDKSGKLLETWGTTYIGGHGLTIVNEGGEQFLLICDTDRHQVIKTDLKGREIFKIEYPKETGVYEHPAQFKPTESAVNPANGDIFVTDGYGLNYVMQYDSKGKYIRHWGGGGDGVDKFKCNHGVVVDTRNKQNPTLIVTSRIENCWKRYTLDGKYLSTIALPGLIGAEATLAFLGVSVLPPTATWGSMLYESVGYFTVDPFYFCVPLTMLLASVLSFNLLGDALQDALDPKAGSS
jgi:hypothetical protein